MSRREAVMSTLVMVVVGTVVMVAAAVILGSVSEQRVPGNLDQAWDAARRFWLLIVLPLILALPYYFQLPKRPDQQ